jgi:two-component system, OmpR family, sensor histidine kinase VicK
MKTLNAPRGLALGIPMWLLFLLGLGVELLLQQYGLRQQQAADQRLLAHASEVKAVLLGELNATLHLATGLASYIQARDGQIDRNEIQPWLQGLFNYGRHIRNIGLAPDNRISFLYPFVGNETVLGLYYPDIPSQWPAVQGIIASGKPGLDGPLQLVQGGQGLIYRVPVFLANGQYWGIISTVIDFDGLLAQAQTVAHQRGITIDLQRRGAQEQTATTPDTETLSLSVPLNMAQSAWDLHAFAPLPDRALSGWLRALGWSVALSASLLIGYTLLSQQRQTDLLTALNLSQKQFLSAFEKAPQAIALVTYQGQLQAVNQALCELLQRSATELLQQSVETLCPRSEGAQLLQHLTEIGPGANSSWHQHLLNSRQEAIAVECSAAILGQFGDTDEVRILHIQDVRERQRLQRLQSEFTASVSHELRTPLTAIAGSLGLINGGALGEVPQAMRSMLEIAQANSQRLQELINDLLDMEKLIAGKMRFELCEQPLWPLLEEAVSHNQPYANLHQVQLRLLGPPCTLPVTVDRQRLAQVLANLLSNAAKFSPAGSKVEISTTVHEAWVRISVRDQGPGISQDFMPRLFNKFAQADGSDSRRKGGTGLGLAISKALVERMEGSIGCDSTLGQGSTFWLELPISMAPRTGSAS